MMHSSASRRKVGRSPWTVHAGSRRGLAPVQRRPRTAIVSSHRPHAWQPIGQHHGFPVRMGGIVCAQEGSPQKTAKDSQQHLKGS